MEMKILNKTDTELEIEIIGENETLLNPITHKLNDNPDVEYATIMTDHPLAPKRTVYIRMKKGDAEKALKNATDTLIKELKAFVKELK